MTSGQSHDSPLLICDERLDEFPAGYRYHQMVGRPGWQFPEHTHKDFCELVCCLEGDIHHRINGQETVQREREVRLIRQSDVHRLYGRRFTYANISFATSQLLDLERFAGLPGLTETLLAAGTSPVAPVQAQDWRAYKRTIEQLAAHMFDPGGRPAFASFLLTTVTRYLAPHPKPGHDVEMPDWLREAMAQMAEPGEPPPTLEKLVRLSGKCHEHFTREFSKRIGITPVRYLTRLRIDRAARMLATSNLKTSVICRACGFESESHFFRQFRRWKGMLPSAYRRTMGSPGLSAGGASISLYGAVGWRETGQSLGSQLITDGRPFTNE